MSMQDRLAQPRDARRDALPFHGVRRERYALPPEFAARLLTPALCIYGALARANIARVLELCGSDPDRWRPHLKTTKSPVLWGWLLDAGVRHFKCATLREARVFCELVDERELADADLLVAQPLAGPALEALAELARAHRRVALAVLCEDVETATRAPAELGLFIDLNNGLDRTGVPLADFERVLAIAAASRQRLRGLHAYEGLVEPDPRLRAARCTRLYESLEQRVAELRAAGTPLEELVTSGTPAFLSALRHAGFRPGSSALGETRHRVSPGTVVLHDGRSAVDVPELQLEPAALVVARVVSRPRAGRATCDAGSKALAAEVGDPCAVPLGLPGLVPATPNEEHLPLDEVGASAPGSSELPERGELVYLVPMHVCPTVNLAESAWLIEEGRAPQRLPITARGHDYEY